MALIAPVITNLKTHGDRDVHTITWEAIGDADQGEGNPTGTWLEMPASSDRSIQVDGTWGSATLVVQGSNDGVSWHTLTDPQGNAISKTADFIEMVTELTRYIRVSTSGGTGTDLDAVLLVKKVR